MEISLCFGPITIEGFQKGIKRDTDLFIKLTKITLSLHMVYKETQKVERELKSTKNSLNKSLDKSTTSGK